MHTVIVVGSGLALLAVLLALAWWLGTGNATLVLAAKAFIPVWLLAAIANLWMGVSKGGYSVVEELPFFAVVFGVPAAVAGLVWWKFS